MHPSEVRLGIGMAVSDTIAYETVGSLLSMVFACKPLKEVHFMMQGGCYVQDNRSKILNKALAHGCTHLFFLDSDMLCPQDTILRLLALDKPVVGAPYNKRQHPPETTVKLYQVADKETGKYRVAIPNEPFKCLALDTGCMLINLDIIKYIEKPYFDLMCDEDGNVVCTEDVWFCRKVLRAGFEIWCDPTIKVGHIGDHTY